VGAGDAGGTGVVSAATGTGCGAAVVDDDAACERDIESGQGNCVWTTGGGTGAAGARLVCIAGAAACTGDAGAAACTCTCGGEAAAAAPPLGSGAGGAPSIVRTTFGGTGDGLTLAAWRGDAVRTLSTASTLKPPITPPASAAPATIGRIFTARTNQLKSGKPAGMMTLRVPLEQPTSREPRRSSKHGVPFRSEAQVTRTQSGEHGVI
jgi:hypothetical protein